MNILQTIKSHDDLVALPGEQIRPLCGEIRQFLREKVARTGGHLASNLGAVELTVALHRVYDPYRDRLLFDVGHQAYVHKMLTGRMEGFERLRCVDGIAGFPKPCESAADPFIAGHASDSVSVALGMARARTLKGEKYDIVAVIGDGALTGGLSYEGLGDAGESGEPLVVVLNDNGMSINRSVGGMARFLSAARTRPGYIRFKRWYRQALKNLPGVYKALHRIKEWVKRRLLPPGIFEDLGFYYIGPVDGHNEAELETVLRWARDMACPVLVHAVTVKGKGVPYAERSPELYHGVGPYDPETGALAPAERDFSQCFGEALTRLAGEDGTVCSVTAAMESGTGLEEFARRYPDRFFEVGIAEGHAAALCGGLASQGLKPVFAVYSTFLQRAYDMLIEDMALMRLHVVLAVDRAGLVGRDGVTHHGCFDVGYLDTVPGMTLYAPASFRELEDMLETALFRETGPVAVRYPRGGEGPYRESHAGEAATCLRTGTDLTIVTHGILINEVLPAAEALAREGISAGVVKLNRLTPLDAEPALAALRGTGRLLVAEEVCRAGGTGTRLLAACAAAGVTLRGARLLDLGSGVITHGDVAVLRRKLGIDREGIAQAAREMLHEEVTAG